MSNDPRPDSGGQALMEYEIAERAHSIIVARPNRILPSAAGADRVLRR